MASTLARRALFHDIHRALSINLSPSISLSPVIRPAIGRFSTGHGPAGGDLSDEERERRLLNRLLYRSRQRGFLELDLVLGRWVEENIESLDEPRIHALVDVLDLENPDLWKWLTGQETPPDSVSGNPVFNAVLKSVMDNLNRVDPTTRASPGQPWVRGWDDKRGLDGPIHGNQ